MDYTDKDIDRLLREQLRWQRAQEVLGAFISGRISHAVDMEDYREAAKWRDLNADLQQADTPADLLHPDIAGEIARDQIALITGHRPA